MKMPKHKALFVTIVPSPYQRDLFSALADQDDVDLRVCYLEAAAPDSPWPEKPLRSFERVMPGFWVPIGETRVHFNWELPDLGWADLIVLSSYTSVTGQWLMRHSLRKKRWLFWGERLHRNAGLKGLLQQSLAAPISHASAVVGVGRAAESDYVHRFPSVPHFSIPYHCDLSEFIRIRRSPGRRPVTFLFCGQMILRKGIDLLLSAFDRLIKNGVDARLLLVGREAVLPQYLSKLGPITQSMIHYAGFQPPELLHEYFEQGDVFVLPSRHDGWGVVVNQALAAGLPVITTNAVGAGLDLVEDGVNGLRINPGDVHALYNAMEMLASKPDTALEWGIKSRERANALTPEVGARKWTNVFASVRDNEGAIS